MCSGICSPATVGEVVERLDGPRVRRTTPSSLCFASSSAKATSATKSTGRAFTYAPIVDRVQARRGALAHVLSRFFNGSREELVMDLLGHEDVDAQQLEQVKALLNDAAAGSAKPGRRR